MKKKHAPIEQLRKAGLEAHKKLVERHIVTEDSSIQRILADNPRMVLPGIPNYIPHKWTIKSSQRMMYDLLRIWQEQCGDDTIVVERLTSFIEFAVAELNKQVDIAEKKMGTMKKFIDKVEDVPVLGVIFQPVNQYQTVKAMNKFMVDSFAVAIMVNGDVATTSEFADWYLEWTNSMYNVWETRHAKTTKK